MIESGGAVLAWLGGALLVLAEGRRSLAGGVVLVGAGLGVTLASAGRVPAAVAVLAAGLLAGLLRLRGGMAGWEMLPPGSTPRMLLAIVAGLVGAFAAVSLVPAPDPPAARAAVVLAGSLTAARLLSTRRRAPALASASAMCLVLAAVEALVNPSAGAAAFAGAVAAAAIALLEGEDAEEGARGGA